MKVITIERKLVGADQKRLRTLLETTGASLPDAGIIWYDLGKVGMQFVAPEELKLALNKNGGKLKPMNKAQAISAIKAGLKARQCGQDGGEFRRAPRLDFRPWGDDPNKADLVMTYNTGRDPIMDRLGVCNAIADVNDIETPLLPNFVPYTPLGHLATRASLGPRGEQLLDAFSRAVPLHSNYEKITVV